MPALNLAMRTYLVLVVARKFYKFLRIFLTLILKGLTILLQNVSQ